MVNQRSVFFCKELATRLAVKDPMDGNVEKFPLCDRGHNHELDDLFNFPEYLVDCPHCNSRFGV